jgi:hypothetical protein
MEEAMTGERHVSANLSRFLKGLDFPAQQVDLVAQAKENGADQGFLDVLEKMPKREYESLADVVETYASYST